MKTKFIARFLILALLGLIQTTVAPAQTTAFTYQGRLNDAGGPANGLYDLTFALHSAAAGPTQIGETVTNIATEVSNGLFTVGLDFGGEFPGADRWLEIGVRTNGLGGFLLLSPRQPVTATPYAITAGSATTYAGPVGAGQISGVLSPSNIGAGSITSTMLAAGSVTSNQLAAEAVNTSTLAYGAVGLPQLMTLTSAPLLTTITNPSPEIFDYFGSAVAVLGTDRVLIGAHGVNSSTGAAYLLGTNGTLLTTFTNPNQETTIHFGSAVAAVGTDLVLIGAHGDNTGEFAAGAAYLFSANGTLMTTITNPTPAFDEHFGSAVAAVGTDRVLIGAYGDKSDEGAAYLFSVNGTLLASFTNPTPAGAEYFGYAVAAVGTDRVLIGAFHDFSGANDGGAAYLFDTNGTLMTTITNPTSAGNADFGRAVAAVGTDLVLIGARGANSYAGAAYLFSLNGTLMTTITNPSPAAFDYFGAAVAAVGTDRILIGAPGDANGSIRAGAAYLFATDGTLLSTFTNSTPADSDFFGSAVAAVGSDQVLIGAQSGNYLVGAAYLFSLSGAPYVPGLVSQGVVAGSIDSAGLARGAVTAEKIADGSVVTNALSEGVLNRTFWKLDGNTGASPSNGVFLGTTDNQPLEFRVNNQRVLRLEASATGESLGLVNVIGGFSGNFVRGGSFGATIGGGGSADHVNQASSFDTVGGGVGNSAKGGAATIGGGFVNTASGAGSAIGGGEGNSTTSNLTTVAGGAANTASGYIATVGGGFFNAASGDYSAVVGGNENKARGAFSSIPGGDHNIASDYAFAAGRRAQANHSGAFVWADSVNADFASTANNQFSVRAGGGVRFMTGGAGMTMDGAPVFAGTDGSSLVNLNASQLAGTLPVGAVGATSIAPDSVTTDKVADGTISSADIADGTIVDADISAEAAISDTKLATIATTGKVADSALSSNIARRNVPNTFTGDQTFTGSIEVGIVMATGFVGNGSGLTNVTAAVLQSAGVANLFKGATVSASGTLIPSGNVFHVQTGSWITAVSSSGFNPGTTITLIFDGSATVLDNDGSLNLAGSFHANANDTLSLVFDGINWYETSRSAN